MTKTHFKNLAFGLVIIGTIPMFLNWLWLIGVVAQPDPAVMDARWWYGSLTNLTAVFILFCTAQE